MEVIQNIRKLSMLNRAVVSIHDHEACFSPLGRGILGNQRRRKSIIEFFYSHFQRRDPPVHFVSSDGCFLVFFPKLLKVNKLYPNLQAKNGFLSIRCPFCQEERDTSYCILRTNLNTLTEKVKR